MRKFIIFENGHREELSPLTFEEFDQYNHWSGANDIAFDQFLRHNKFHELEDFHRDVVMVAKIVLEPGEPVIDWSVIYGEL
jgi:hypothetical protein